MQEPAFQSMTDFRFDLNEGGKNGKVDLNFEFVKVGHKIIMPNTFYCYPVESLEVSKFLDHLKSNFNKILKNEDVTERSFVRGEGPTVGIVETVYYQTAGFFSSQLRLKLIDLFEKGDGVTLYQLSGDQNVFVGLKFVKMGIWEICLA